MLLGLVFVFILTLVFSAVFAATRPSGEQKQMDRRLLETLATSSSKAAGSIPLPTHLEITEKSSFAFVDQLVSETWLARKLRILIVQGQVPVTVGTLVVAVVGAGAAVFAVTLIATSLLLVALLASLFGAGIPLAYLLLKRSRRVSAFNAALPECIEMCARSLRVGNSIVAAIDIVASEAPEPAKTEFAEVFKKQNYGLPLKEALLQMLDRVPSMDLQVFVTGILVQKDTGGNLAEVLDRIVAVIRERLRIQREIQTHTAQGRLTGWILCLLPVVMLVLINIINPGYSDVLFHEPLGHKMLYAGAGLLALGALLIRNIVKGIEV